MDAKTERKMAGWQELYSSLQTNIQAASAELTAVFDSCALRNEELTDLVKKIGNKNEELKSIENECERRLEEVKKKEEQLVLREKEAERNVLAAQKEVYEAREHREEMRKTKDALFSDAEELKRKIALLKSDAAGLLKVKEKVEEKEKDLDNLKGACGKMLERIKNENDKAEETFLQLSKREEEKKKEIETLEKTIFEKQRSLDGFKENKKFLEDELMRKEHDYQIKLGRLRKIYAEMGKDLVIR